MSWKVLRWRIYAVLLAVIDIATLLSDRGGIIATANQLFTLVCVTGLMGYAFGWRIIGAGFWKVVFPFALVSFVITFALTTMAFGWAAATVGLSPAQGAFVGSLGAAIVAFFEVPVVVALFRYGYRCERFWNAGKPSAAASPALAPAPRR